MYALSTNWADILHMVQACAYSEDSNNLASDLVTVLPAKSDSDVMLCLQSYQGLRIDISLVY